MRTGKKRRRRRRRRRRRSRKNFRRNQRGGHAPSYSRGGTPSLSGMINSFLPADVIDLGRDIGTGARNYLHKYEGAVPEVGGNVMKQPDLKVINKPTHIF